MGFLRRRGYTDSLAAFELESGVSEADLGNSLHYLKQLILTGRWDDALSYLTPLKKTVVNYERTEFLLRRQQFLEALSWHGAGGHPKWSLAWSPHHDGLGNGQSMDAVVALLKSMEGKCTAGEFDSLCLCLTLEDIRENAEFSTWSVSRGRQGCFEALRLVLGRFVEGHNSAPSSFPGLETHVAMGLKVCYDFAGPRASEAIVVTLEDGLIGLEGFEVERNELPTLHLIPPKGRDPMAMIGGDDAASSGAADGTGMQWPSSPVRAPQSSARSSGTAFSGAAPAFRHSSEATRRSTGSLNGSRSSRDGPLIKPRAPVSWTVTLDEEQGEKEKAARPRAPMLSRGRPRGVQEDAMPEEVDNLGSVAGTEHDAALSAEASAGVGSPIRRAPAQQQVPPSPAPVRSPEATAIFQADQPLRCIVSMDEPGATYVRGPDDTVTMAVGCNDKSIRVMSWHSAAGSTVLTHLEDVHRGSVYGLDHHAESGTLASCSNDKSVRLYAPQRNHVGKPMRGHTGTVRAVKFAPSTGTHGLLLASAGAGDCRPRVWDVKTEACLFLADAHTRPVHTISWWDTNVLLSGCEEGQIIATDMRMRQRAWAFTALGLSDGMARSICCMDSMGDFIATGTPEGAVDILSVSQLKPLVQSRMHASDVRSLAFEPHWAGANGTHSEPSFPLNLLVGSYDGTASVCELGPSVRTGNMRLQTNLRYTHHTDKVLGTAWLCGGRAVTSGADGALLLWQT